MINFYVRVNRFHLLTFLSLVHCCISPAISPPVRDLLYGVCPCCMCRVSLVSQGTSRLVLRHGPSLAFEYVLRGRGVSAVVSTPQHIVFNFWSDQSSYSTCLLLHCQQPQWRSVILMLLLFSDFGRSATCTAFSKYPPLDLAICSSLACQCHLVWFNGCKANERCVFPCWRLSLIYFIAALLLSCGGPICSCTMGAHFGSQMRRMKKKWCLISNW